MKPLTEFYDQTANGGGHEVLEVTEEHARAPLRHRKPVHVQGTEPSRPVDYGNVAILASCLLEQSSKHPGRRAGTKPHPHKEKKR